MSERIPVSATIVTYHSYDKARQAVESILKYTEGVDLTLYIVDNASKDGTLEKIKEEFPSVVTIQNPRNGGFGYGHNAVLPVPTSKYHAFVNPDILFDRDVLTELAQYMEAHEDVGQVTPEIRFPNGEIQRIGRRTPVYGALVGRHIFEKKLKPIVDEYLMMDTDFSEPTEIENVTGCFSLIRTDLFKQLKGYDERFFLYFEDFDISRRVRLTHRAIYYPHTYVFHAWEREYNHSFKYLLILVWSSFLYFGKWGFHWDYSYQKKGNNK